MEFQEIMNLPPETENNVVFELLKRSVTQEDIDQGGTNPVVFAYAHLIAWAIRNKKYYEYYTYIKQFKEENAYFDALKCLEKNKTVLVSINCAGKATFGCYTEDDGEPALCFPKKDGIYCIYL